MEVRGEVYFPLSGFRRFNEEQVAAGKAPAPNPRNAAAGSLRQLDSRITAARPLAVWVYGTGYREGVAPDTHFETLAWLRERGFRTNPFAERFESIEEVAKAIEGWEKRRRRARLRDRRDRDQGRLLRPAAAARRAARAAPLGARLQVGADDRRDEAGEDRDPRRPHRRAQPVGDPRAGQRRRRHRLPRDAAQRGGHQPQADPRGRPRHRPARRRRDPADRRPGRAAREGHEGVQDARALPALRRRDRQAGGRGHAPLPEPRLPLARARDAEQLGHGCDGHRGRGGAVRPAALGRGAAALDARPLPADRRAADGARRLRGDLGAERGRGDPAVEGAAVLARPLRAQHPRRRLGDGAQPRAPLRRRRPAPRREPGGHPGGRRHRPRPGRGDRRLVRRRAEPDARRPSCASSGSASRSATRRSRWRGR